MNHYWFHLISFIRNKIVILILSVIFKTALKMWKTGRMFNLILEMVSLVTLKCNFIFVREYLNLVEMNVMMTQMKCSDL